MNRRSFIGWLGLTATAAATSAVTALALSKKKPQPTPPPRDKTRIMLEEAVAAAMQGMTVLVVMKDWDAAKRTSPVIHEISREMWSVGVYYKESIGFFRFNSPGYLRVVSAESHAGRGCRHSRAYIDHAVPDEKLGELKANLMISSQYVYWFPSRSEWPAWTRFPPRGDWMACGGLSGMKCV